MRPLAGLVDEYCRKRIGRKPNLSDPRGYNDKIQWLKLHDQRPEHIIACDKWAVREWVAERADCLIPATMGLADASLPFIAKCSHDSGSAVRVDTEHDRHRAFDKLAKRLTRPYGAEKGEWAYQFVPARIVSEQALPGPVTDYKFHCVHGEVRWVQVIWNRQTGHPWEAIFTPEGEVTALHMDEKMRHRPDQGKHPGGEAWRELTALAEKLAEGWRYVRVDLYWSQGKAWFGELTFWPRAGCYQSADEPVFGELLDIDMGEKLQPVVA